MSDTGNDPSEDQLANVADMLRWSDEEWSELGELLGAELSPGQIRQILEFAAQVGGIEKAIESLIALDDGEQDLNRRRAA